MPRDVSGNFSLVAGNPVAGGTPIEPSWANDTLNDIANAMTESLSRTGEGGMLVPFQNADGTEGSPGITWVQEPGSGFYRAGSKDQRASIGGIDTTRWIDATGQAAGLQKPFEIWDGTAWAAPAVLTGDDLVLVGALSVGNNGTSVGRFEYDDGTEIASVLTAGAKALDIHLSGITAVDDVTAFSDSKLKDNIAAIPDALAKVLTLTGTTYNRNDIGGPRRAGLIAQDVLAVLPEAVFDHDGTLALNYNAVVGLLVEAIKEIAGRR